MDQPLPSSSSSLGGRGSESPSLPGRTSLPSLSVSGLDGLFQRQQNLRVQQSLAEGVQVCYLSSVWTNFHFCLKPNICAQRNLARIFCLCILYVWQKLHATFVQIIAWICLFRATCLVQQDFLNIHGATLSRVTRCVRCTKLHCWDLYYVYNTCTYRSSNKDTLYTSVYVRLHLVLVGEKEEKERKLVCMEG